MRIFDIYRKEATAAKAETDKLVSEFEHALSALELGILDRSAHAIDGILDRAKTERDRLMAEISSDQDFIKAATADSEARIAGWLEEVRHTDVVIGVFGSAQALLEAGYDKTPPAAVQAQVEIVPLDAAEPGPAAVVVAVAAE